MSDTKSPMFNTDDIFGGDCSYFSDDLFVNNNNNNSQPQPQPQPQPPPPLPLPRKVADSRAIVEPKTSEEFMECILNALNCLVPSMAYWQYGGFRFLCAILGFFFSGSRLHCIMVPLQTCESNEYYSFFADLVHILQANRAYFSSTDQKSIDTIGPHLITDLRYLHIKTADHSWANLRQHIWATIMNGKYNQTAQNWFHSDFLRAAYVEAPHDFRGLTNEIAGDLEFRALFGPTPCFSNTCRCRDVGRKLMYEKEIGLRELDAVLTIEEILPHVRSGLLPKIKLYLAPAIRNIQRNMNVHPSKPRKTNVVKASCLLATENCSGFLVGGWSECCSHPTICEYHTEKHRQTARSWCSKHGRSGMIVSGMKKRRI
jgi:hypothetical protein